MSEVESEIPIWDRLPAQVVSLVAILKRLRAPGGCPWDRKQTSHTLAECLAGEVAELLDAIDADDAPNIAEELGDVLMNLVFQAVVAEEKGQFDWDDVVREINAKMIRRHCHIFGDAEAADAEDVVALWTKIKAEEKARQPRPASILDRIPASMSALATAVEIQKLVSRVGFDWADQFQVLDKIEEELAEVRAAIASGDEVHVDEEIGDLLFAVSNLSRIRKRQSAEEALRRANAKFKRRFQYIEARLEADGVPLETAGLPRLEALWQEAKHHE